MKIEPPNWADITAAGAAIVAALAGLADLAFGVRDRFRNRPVRAWARYDTNGSEGLVRLRLAACGDAPVYLRRVAIGRGLEVAEARMTTNSLGEDIPGPPNAFVRQLKLSLSVGGGGGSVIWLHVRSSRSRRSASRTQRGVRLSLSFSISDDPHPRRLRITTMIAAD